jgi:hypothetical protein
MTESRKREQIDVTVPEKSSSEHASATTIEDTVFSIQSVLMVYI